MFVALLQNKHMLTFFTKYIHISYIYKPQMSSLKVSLYQSFGSGKAAMISVSLPPISFIRHTFQ